MFGEIERNAGAVFFGLTKDIGSLFGEILPEARDIVIEDLGLGSINVQDAGGLPRTLDNLSQGTRDSFWFAARLALSVRAAPDGCSCSLTSPSFLWMRSAKVEASNAEEFSRKEETPSHYIRQGKEACGKVARTLSRSSGTRSGVIRRAMKDAISLTQAQLPEFLLNVAVVRPVFIWGAPGIGKSALVQQFAQRLGLDCVSLLGNHNWRPRI